MKSQNLFTTETGSNTIELAGKKILFANFAADGHFNPLTGLAVHLQSLGCDVRWYTSDSYAAKLQNLQIPHYPFVKALDVCGDNIEKLFPERKKINNKIAKLNYDFINAFILRGPEYYADLQEVYKVFPFDILVADCCFTGVPFVTDKMNIPVISVGIAPLF
jgi:UDP:flavonoid glycosyltransferase YjiC (YdhE family)